MSRLVFGSTRQYNSYAMRLYKIKEYIREHTDKSNDTIARKTASSPATVQLLREIVETNLDQTKDMGNGAGTSKVDWEKPKYEKKLFKLYNQDLDLTEITQKFNKKFGVDYSPRFLAVHIPQHDSYGRQTTSGEFEKYEYKSTKHNIDWTRKDIQKFIEINKDNFTFSKLTEKFNLAFNANVSQSCMRRQIQEKGWPNECYCTNEAHKPYFAISDPGGAPQCKVCGRYMTRTPES